MSTFERHLEIDEATVLSQLSLLLLTIILVHEGHPTPQERVMLELDRATVLQAEALMEQLTSTLETKGIEAPSAPKMAEYLTSMGFELHTHGSNGESHDAVTRATGGFVCIKGPDDFPGCCVRMPSIFHP